MISYSFDDDGILRVVFVNNIVYNDIQNWLIEFSKITGLPDKIFLLYDMRNANLLIDMIKLIQISKKTEEVTSKFKKVRTAFLIDDSVISTISLLFSFLDVNGRTSRKVFTRDDKALEWLHSEMASN